MIGRIDVGDHAVAVPLKISHVGVLGHDAVNNAKHIVLNLRVRDVEHQLVAIVICVAFRLHNNPIGMFLEELALGVDHLRLYPDAKLHACLLCISHQSGYSFRELALCGFPVAQASMVVLARILVGKPSVVEQEHVHTQVLGVLHQLSKALLVEVEARVLPVVEQSEAVVHAHVHLILACPVVQVA